MRNYKPAEAYKAEFQKISKKFLLKTGFSVLAIFILCAAFWMAQK
jgi:hypothetical protein